MQQPSVTGFHQASVYLQVQQASGIEGLFASPYQGAEVYSDVAQCIFSLINFQQGCRSLLAPAFVPGRISDQFSNLLWACAAMLSTLSQLATVSVQRSLENTHCCYLQVA